MQGILKTEQVLVGNVYPASYLHLKPGPDDNVSVFNAPVPVVNRRTGNVVIGAVTFAEHVACGFDRVTCYVINVSEENEASLFDYFNDTDEQWEVDRLLDPLRDIVNGHSITPVGFDASLLDDIFSDAGEVGDMFDKQRIVNDLIKGR